MVFFILGSRRYFENKIKYKLYVLDDVDLIELFVEILLILDFLIMCLVIVLIVLYGYGYSLLVF